MSVSPSNAIGPVRYKVKVKSLYLTSVVTSVTKMVSMKANGAPFTPLPPSVSAPFYRYLKL